VIAGNAEMVPVTQGTVTCREAANPLEPQGHSNPMPLRPVEPGTVNTTAGTIRSTFLHCPMCNLKVDNMSLLVGHIKAMRDPHHRRPSLGRSRPTNH
jgi:hypothetical protein